jgi:hypothetical protein
MSFRHASSKVGQAQAQQATPRIGRRQAPDQAVEAVSFHPASFRTMLVFA